MKTLILVFLFMHSHAFPDEAKMLHLPEIGDHYKILSFEKNENPQNIMVVYTKLDGDCRFIKKNGKPMMDFYWLMDGQRYKPTHPLIKDAVRKRLEVASAKDDEFELKVNDLKELNTKSAQPHMLVKAEKNSGMCRVTAYFPDDQGHTIAVRSIFSESKKTFLPPFRKLLAVTIHGTVSDSGQTVQRKYVAE